MNEISLKREFLIHLTLLFTTCVAVIWVRTATVRESYRFIQQEREYRKTQEGIQAARVQWLKLTAPKKLEKWAAELNLYPPKPDQVWKYEPEKLHSNR